VHALAGGHPGHGVGGYLLVFFAIWWAWVNFTWFASGYDTDDVPYRLTTLLQITGVLVLAAGVPRAFSDANYTIATTGYLIMRVALTLQWLRAARGETGAARKAALTYAACLVVVQACWVLLLVLPGHAWEYGVGPLALAELAVPAGAERVHPTSWHPGHIADRYGGFTIIVLGESISAATVAVQSALDQQTDLAELLPIAFGGLVIVFAAFWVYFATPVETYIGSGSERRVFGWGYGHYLIFASAAAIGAGLEVATLQVTGESHISALAAALAVTVPTALYSVAVWLVHVRPFKHDFWQQLVFPASALLVLAASFAGHWAVPLAGLAAAAGVAVAIALAAREQRRTMEA
jgi:low temperature requirement protein LtrA